MCTLASLLVLLKDWKTISLQLSQMYHSVKIKIPKLSKLPAVKPCCKVHNTTVSVHRVSGSGGYRAPVRTLPHGLDQLVDLLVVFQGVPQGVLGAEQPLPEAVHLRVQRRRVQHGVAPVIWRRAFPALEGARQEDSKRHRDGVSTFRFVDVCGFLSDDRFTSERRLPPSGIGEE